MIISGEKLHILCATTFTPFIPEKKQAHGRSYGLGQSSYDIRLKQDLWLPPQCFRIASTVDEWDMPLDVHCIIHDKSTNIRMGISVFNTLVDAGWSGFLTLEIKNNTWMPKRLKAGTPIAQAVFHRLECPVSGYAGKYQNQKDEPVAAIMEG